MSNFPTGGHVSDSKEDPIIVRNIEGLIFSRDEVCDGIRKNWNDHLNSLGVDESVKEEVGVGSISEDLAAKLLKSLKSNPTLEYDKYSCSIEFVASPMKPQEAKLWTKFLPYFDFKKEQLDIVKEVCEELRPSIEDYLGTPFKLINTKGWETRPKSAHFGPNKIHTDSLYPEHTYKVFLYLTGASEKIGTTKLFLDTPLDFTDADPAELFTVEKGRIITIKGPPGTFVLFNPVSVKHSGVAPIEANRAILELILVPSSKTEINPVFGGVNSTHPINCV